MEGNTFQLRHQNIVIISQEDWGQNLLSKHHIALTLTKVDNTVWFVCPMTSGPSLTVEQVGDKLSVIRCLPTPGINRLPVFIARVVARHALRKVLSIIGTKIDIVWSFDPYHFQFLRLFKSRLTIYHPVDNHYTYLENRIVGEADILLSNSDATLARLNHANKHRIGHGVAKYFFESNEPFGLPGDYPIKVGYVGNLNNRLFDFDLFVKLVTEHPQIGFYLVGPRSVSNLSAVESSFFDWSSVDKLSNVFWLGEHPSYRIPSFLMAMDVLLILYRPDKEGFTVSPHKTLEYLSSGKVVITPFHLENTEIEHLILQASALSEIPTALGEVLQAPEKFLTSELSSKRILYASERTYDKRVQQIEHICRQTLERNAK